MMILTFLFTEYGFEYNKMKEYSGEMILTQCLLLYSPIMIKKVNILRNYFVNIR
jgi:hypothetical protein